MKTYKQFISEAWIPPASKKLRGGTESPLSVARKKGTNVDTVRSSVKRFAEPINNPNNPDYDYSKSSSGNITVKSKTHPIEVSYTQGDSPNTFIQNTRTTGEVKGSRALAAREMQNIKKAVSKSARPGTTILSQPVGDKRASLNTRTQGMGSTNEKGVQGGIARHRSPRQLAKGAKPLDPIKYKGTYIDPTHN